MKKKKKKHTQSDKKKTIVCFLKKISLYALACLTSWCFIIIIFFIFIVFVTFKLNSKIHKLRLAKKKGEKKKK